MTRACTERPPIPAHVERPGEMPSAGWVTGDGSRSRDMRHGSLDVGRWSLFLPVLLLVSATSRGCYLCYYY
jgi:hypothetical protein